MNRYYKIIILLLISILFYLNSYAGFHLGLSSAVKTKVQELKDKYDEKQEENNHLPIITSLAADPGTLLGGAVTTITCNASDPHNDLLTYTWSAAKGTISGNGAHITWAAPATKGSYTVTCTVSNVAGGVTSQSVTIAVKTIATKLWTKLLGTSGTDAGRGVATDSLGNIYVTGWTEGDLDGHASHGYQDIFLIKYDASGAILWSKLLGTSEDDQGAGIAIDSSDHIYVTGYTGDINQRGEDVFLTKFDTSGNALWTEQIDTGGSEEGVAVATDSSGNIYITGYTDADLDGYVNQGEDDIFLAKYDANGTKLWAKELGTRGDEEGMSVATDSLGNVYVTGWTTGDLDGNKNQGGTWPVDAFLIKYDTNGTKLWTKQFGTNEWDEGHGVVTDSLGNIYVTGWTAGNLDGNASNGYTDIFLTKYDTNGTKLWTKLLGASGEDKGLGVAIDQSGDIYITGETDSNLVDNTFQVGNDILNNLELLLQMRA